MTLVAAYSVEGYPVLLGDLLISGKEQIDKKIGLPTISEIKDVFPEGSGFTVVGMKQKLHIIDDNIVIGWADSSFAARITIKELKKRFSGEIVSRDILKTVFESLDPYLLMNVNIVGCHYDGNGFYTFGFNCLGFSTSVYGEVRLAGSGATDLHEFMLNSLEMSENSLKMISERNPLEKAVITSLSLTNMFLGIEVNTHISIQQYYGGGFEVVSHAKGKFTKVGDITYQFADIAEQDDGTFVVALPNRVNKYAYEDDLLIIRSMELEPTVSENSGVIEIQIHNERLDVVEPIDKKIEGSEFEKMGVPDLNSKFTCSSFRLFRKDGSVGFLQATNYSSEKKNSLVFEENNEKIGVRIHADYITRAIQIAEANCLDYYSS